MHAAADGLDGGRSARRFSIDNIPLSLRLPNRNIVVAAVVHPHQPKQIVAAGEGILAGLKIAGKHKNYRRGEHPDG